MILIVDDELSLMTFLTRSLELEGYTVEGYTSAEEALERASRAEPELIISDIMMPGMDGHQFHAEYRRRHPRRSTPFVYLSALSDASEVVRGLDAGADDYLAKPIDRHVLAAKVRALLRRRSDSKQAIFRGRLEQFSLVQVLQFCEQRGLTGKVEFALGEGSISLGFDAGEMVLGDDEEETSSKLSELMELNSGTFVIHSWPAQFDELQPAQPKESRTVVAALRPAVLPLGRLSGVRVGDRLVQLQTEYEPPPAHRVVTLVVYEGEVIRKETTTPAADITAEALHAAMDRQHAEMEQEVRRRLSALTRKHTNQIVTQPDVSKDRLFELGMQKWREKDYRGALELLEKAHAISPDDRILKKNLEIMRRKLEPKL